MIKKVLSEFLYKSDKKLVLDNNDDNNNELNNIYESKPEKNQNFKLQENKFNFYNKNYGLKKTKNYLSNKDKKNYFINFGNLTKDILNKKKNWNFL